ncbi:hypothetical protein FB451DRAFT_1289202 [Mycena latifolia]|nr:hypothetical protein FB451DRAFT_1289202 [Mycena latifolia]
MDIVCQISPPPFAQELWDHILSFLRGQITDLKACSCVSRTLCAAAQPQLFHTIAINPSRGVQWKNNRLVYNNESAAALRALLAQSPHLVPHIRRLEIDLRLTAGVLEEILAMGLTCVRELQIHTGHRIDESVVELARRLICLPTVECVEVCSMTLSKRFFSLLFAGPAPQLRKIDIEGSTHDPREILDEEQDEDAPVQILTPARPSVTHLRLVYSRDYVPWLLGAACPFDLEHITHADVSSTLNAGLTSILLGAYQTLRVLTVMPDDLTHCPPLCLLPSLTHLTLKVHNETVPPQPLWLETFPSWLETLHPDNRVCAITISIGLLCIYAQWMRELAGIDVRVAQIGLPALRCFEVRLPSPGDAAERGRVTYFEGMKKSYVEALARLKARGVLVVRVGD